MLGRLWWAVVFALVLAGCSGNGRPENALTHAVWKGDGTSDALLVSVSVFDDKWVSVACDCDIRLELDGVDLGTWHATPGDFDHKGGAQNPTFTQEIAASQVPACEGYQVAHHLQATIRTKATIIEAAWMVQCKPAPDS